jgi:thiopurine S-methyltransferase
MQASFWHERWESSDIGFHRQEIDALLRQYWSGLALGHGQRVLAPLCGKSLDLLWLAGAGHPVTGVELSPLACAAFFAENRLSPRRYQRGPFEVWEADEIRILQGDFFDLGPSEVAECAGVYDRAALIALPPPMRADYVRHLAAILPAGVRMLLLTLEYDQSARAGPPFAVGEAEVRALYEPSYAVELLDTRDALAPDSPWRRQGLTWLTETVYRIVHRQPAAAAPQPAEQ